MVSATTLDSKSLMIDYTVNSTLSPTTPLTFGVYRAPSTQFEPSTDVSVATLQVSTTVPATNTPALDNNGQPVSAVGNHTLTLPLANGLPLNPLNPYVLVVANPTSPVAASDPSETASFRVYTIGIVTHGGIQDTSWKYGPPWQLVMAKLLQDSDGYDAVVKFNWVSESGTPGSAAKQVPRLVNQVLAAVNQFPANSVVDLHFIGHSEGTIINELTISQIEDAPPPSVKAGWLEMTMLDPHAANNAVDHAAKQFSTAGLLAPLATMEISHYQSEAKDPAPYVPAGVDQTQVFYQHTTASAGAIYNLWGQVPIRGQADYYNLTHAGVHHSGNSGIYWWYINGVVPTLGDGAPIVTQRALNGAVSSADIVASGTAPGGFPEVTVNTHKPVVTGTSAPGSKVVIFGGPAHDPAVIQRIGHGITAADGTFSITTHHLRAGSYRFVAFAHGPMGQGVPWKGVMPMAPLGQVNVLRGRP
jgi:hypothetical protein